MNDVELTTSTEIIWSGGRMPHWRAEVTVKSESPYGYAGDYTYTLFRWGARFWAWKKGIVFRREVRRQISNKYPIIRKTKVSL